MKIRGFEVVADEFRQYTDTERSEIYTEKIDVDGQIYFTPSITLPTRADERSSGYDFYAPVDVALLPAQKTIIWTNVKAYMGDDEELKLYIRSSLAVKQGLMLSNNVGKVDASYYENEGNDGNIGIALVNTSGKEVKIYAGDRIAQGSFYKYLIADEDNTLHSERTGGFGSSNR